MSIDFELAERYRFCQQSSSSLGSSVIYLVGLSSTVSERLVAVRWGSMCSAVVQPAFSLEGGYLDRPVLHPTTPLGARAFVQVHRRNHALMKFLTGTRSKLSPLQGLPLFEKLLVLRNDATRKHGRTINQDPTAAVDDLGLDEGGPTKLSLRAEVRLAQRESMVPTCIVAIHIEGKSFSVLSGRGREPVFMEATSQQMSTLHDLVSTELDARSLEPASEPPAADSSEGHSEAEAPEAEAPEADWGDGTRAGGDGTRAGGDLEPEPEPVEQVPGLTWVPKRSAWVLRYEDNEGKKRQKRFAATECTRAGQAEALRWLDEYQNEWRKEDLEV